MLNGDALTTKRSSFRPEARGFKLLDQAGADTDGVWVDVQDLKPGAIEIFGGSFDATVEIRGSNADTIPDNTSHGTKIGSDVTAEGFVVLPHRTRFLKARVVSYVSGTISAFYHSVTG